jgi:hypothetical protein
MPPAASPTVIRQTERWFVRRGTPTMIKGYGFVSHVLPRMLPALSFVALASLAWLVLLRVVGSWRWSLLAGIVVLTLAVWTTTSLFVRRLPTFSRRATLAVLIAYATLPVAVPLLQLAVHDEITAPGGSVVGLLGFVVFFAAAFLATALATTYGLGAQLRGALRHTLYDLRNSARLLGRALPTLLFVTLFLFFTGELWQAMNRLEWWRLGLVVGLFAAITVLAAAARLRDEIGRVEQDLAPEQLAAACAGTPLARAELPTEPVPPMPLTGRQSRNLLVLLATRQLTQAAVVGLALFGFFLVLGVTVVKPETAEQWIGAPPAYSSLLPTVPAALLRNATLLAAFGSMYFTVTSMIDTDHRRQFFAPIIDEIERTLTVRAVYLAVR